MPEGRFAGYFRQADAQAPRARGRFARYFRSPRRGETAQKPAQKQAVSNWERILLQNVGSNDPQKRADWLKRRGYEAQGLPSGQVAARKRGAQEWGVIDERGGSLMDILDIGDEVAFGLAVGAGGAAGAPAGLLGAAGGAAVGGGAAESVKKALGAMAGFHETPREILTDVAVSGALGGALDLGLRGAGRGLKHLFRRAKPPKVAPGVAPEMPPKVAPEVPEVRPEIKPEVRPEVRPEIRPKIPPEVAPEVAPPGLPGAPPGPPPPGGRLPPGPPGGRLPPGSPGGPGGPPGVPPPPGGRPRTPTVRHTLTTEEGGIRQTTERIAPPAEAVKPLLTPAEAEGLVVGRASKVVELVDPAPGEAVYITFLKKAKKGETPEVRTMRVHGNARGPTWLSEAEVRQQTDDMPLSMLRELVGEQGPPPSIIKKTYGTNEPASLERDALAKWLFEKQPGVVTGRAGPPGTRAAENRANQLFQFWEQFSEYTPEKSAARSARTMLRDLIPGRKEFGGYRRGAAENVLELRVGDRVYRFGPKGNPRLIKGEPKPPSTTPPSEPPIAGQKPKEEPTLLGAAKTSMRAFEKVKTVKDLLSASRWTPTRLLIRGVKAALRSAGKSPESYKGASGPIKRAMANVVRVLKSKGREAALAAAYSIAQDNKEFRTWLENLGE